QTSAPLFPYTTLFRSVEIDRLAIQMHRDDRLRARRDRCLDLVHIHQEIVVPDIDEHRPRAERPYRGDRGYRRVRHRDDFITRGRSEEHTSELQSQSNL